MRKIGLLGGIGPEATGIFYLRLIDTMQKREMIKSNADFPQIVINSVPAAELFFDESKEEDLSLYTMGLKELDANKVEFIAMACNTIHTYHSRLQKEVSVPILDLRAEFGAYVAKNGIDSVLLLATPTTIRSDLFKVERVNYYLPDAAEMEAISNTIFNFNLGKEKAAQGEVLEKIGQKYVAQGARLVVLGCTEIALMLADSKLPKLDTMDLLIDAIISRLSG
ncbi:MAG: amino acid racemase [Candidatus Micrarchaeota archaeon]|nr:amino acid racemase [Candidatus Micrarchaeota archaeon]